MTIAITRLSPRPQAALPQPRFHHWEVDGGELWAELFRLPEGGYRIRFPDLADFDVAADGLQITCMPAPDCDADTCEHLLLNQIVPVALDGQGETVYHASAVAIDGTVIAFAGESGMGKSTLALALARAGAELVTDDGLHLRRHADMWLAHPNHPSVRLWEDSRDAILGSIGAAATLQAAYTRKGRYMAGAELCRMASQPLPLRAICFLEWQDDSERLVQERLTQPRLQRIEAADAAIRWVKHSFLLDVGDKSAIARHFHQATSLASAIPAFTLDYPRDYARLPEVMDAVRGLR